MESVRRTVARGKWFWLLHAGGCVFCTAAFLSVWETIQSESSLFASLGGTVHGGAAIGVALGGFAGVLVVLGARHAILVGLYRGTMRTERLMLRFHDELKRQASNAQQSDEPAGR